MTEPGSKIAERLLARPSGATMDELIAATGGPQYNVLRRLAARGYRVRKVREGRVTRYFAEPPAHRSVTLSVSPKGQVTIPKDFREKLGVARGGELRLSFEEQGRAYVDAPRKSVRDLFGALGKPKRHLTLEQIEQGIVAAAIGRATRR